MKDHSTTVKVRGYHMDLNRHVNNARYLEFLEEARWQYYEDILQPEFFEKQAWAFVVVNTYIDFYNPALPGDILTITTGVKKVGNKSVTLKHTITKQSNHLTVATADVTFVIADQNTGKALPVQGKVKKFLFNE